MPKRVSQRPPKSGAHRRLGKELRAIREGAGKRMRDKEAFDVSSGYISEVENGHVTPSEKLLNAYARLGGHYGLLMALLSDAKAADEGINQDSAVANPLTRPAGDKDDGATLPLNAAGWYLSLFKVLLRMDKPSPEAFEERRIVATTDGLERTFTSGAILRHPEDASPRHEIIVEPMYGCLFEDFELPTENYYRQFIRLPYPLKAGESHQYGILVRVPKGQPMLPRYGLTPLRRLDFFELRVRFAADNRPRRVWRLEGISPLVIDDWANPGDIIEVDPVNEIHVTFRDLAEGLTYGVKWEG
jgi:transcriptional regulator with XRE-family HTH domain